MAAIWIYSMLRKHLQFGICLPATSAKFHYPTISNFASVADTVFILSVLVVSCYYKRLLESNIRYYNNFIVAYT